MALTATAGAEPRVSTETADQADLVRRAAAGDDDAFRLLVRQLLPRLRRWALARSGDPDDADEVVQRTLIRMHRGLGTFRGRGKLSTWLYRILANAATDLERGRAAGPDVRAGPLTEPEAAAEPDPVRRLHAGRIAAVVRDHLASLPARQREVLVMVDHDGMRPVEVAEILELEPVTVRAHLFRARRAVRTHILETFPELREGYDA